MDVRGTHLHAEGVFEPRGLEGLAPPACPLEQRGAERLGHPRVEVVDDGLLHVGQPRPRVPLLQAMAADEPPLERLVEPRRPLLVRHAEIAGARVEGTRAVVPVGQLDERVVDAQARRFSGSRHLAYALEEAAACEVRPGAGRGPALRWPRRLLAHVGKLDLHLRVLREVEGAGHGYAAALLVELVAPGPEPGSEIQVVANEPVGRVHQHAAARFGGDGKAPQHRAGESVAHRTHLVRVRGGRAERVVGLDHEHLRTHAFEHHDVRVRESAAVEADVVRSQSRGEAVRVQHLETEAVDLEVEPALGLVPVERQEAVELAHSRRLRLDRGRRSLRCGLRGGRSGARE